MKNNYCKLSQEEIVKLNVPNKFKGFFLSPFQFNLQNGYIKVPEDVFVEMIEELVNYAKTKEPTWISVNDRLPEGEVLFCDGFGQRMVGQIREISGGYCCIDQAGGMLIYVTRWMPLPEPPKEGE